MRGWSAELIARASGARLLAGEGAAGGPRAVGIDSRALARGALFVGLRGERTDGGAHAAQALAAGAWGVLVAPGHAREAVRAATGDGVVLEHEDPLAALHALARAWRRALGERCAKVIAVTGSTGKTSTKEILAALLGGKRRAAMSAANFNTEIGLPLAVLDAAADTEVLVLEMAMRGSGQIAELTAIAEPDVGVIVNVGPAHLELLGSLEAIAAAKAELIAGMKPGATAVVPAEEPLLAPHLRADLNTVTFGACGDVRLLDARVDGEVVIGARGTSIVLAPSFRQAHQLRNLLAAVAAALAVGVEPTGRVEVSFGEMRGERVRVRGGAMLINDCYNANPMSMRAAIDELAEAAPARRVAVLGEMLELGADAPALHREIGRHAAIRGVDVLIAVGPLGVHIAEGFAGEKHLVADAAAAAATLEGLLRADDTVLVKASRGVALEGVVQELSRRAHAETTPAGGRAG